MADLGPMRSLLGASAFGGEVLTDAATRAVYSTDNSIYQLKPLGVAIPRSEEDLSVLMGANHALDAPMSIVARGGGTGTNGQSLSTGLVVDTRRAMNRILSIDHDAQEAVVQPGVVLAQLNAEISKHGLFFAPHVSTATRATIGGMAATDAAGKGSLVHGRTNDHIIALRGVFADGTTHRFEAIPVAEAEARAGQAGRIGVVYRSVLDAADGLTAADFPEVPRGFSGYNLADVRSGSDVDLTKVLCGSEGTLAMMSELTLRLSPVPSDPWLAVVAFETFDDAIGQSNVLKEARPTAIECLDERTIQLATGSPAWPKLAQILPNASGSLLLLEFDGGEGIEHLRALLEESAAATGFACTDDRGTIAAVWKVRADAVGLLGQEVEGRRSVPFVEDCAVPPRYLPEFVSGFRNLLDRHGLSYGMFGHADVGCVHVRPALDLYREDHEAMVRTISDEVASLVASFGGVLWGEHGRGFRGEFLDIGDDLTRRMRMVKSGFDPNNLLNPGKLYTPLDDAAPIRRIDEVPLRVHRDRTVAGATRARFDSAFACNGNGICHHWGAAEVMCPSFKVTLDPRLSPKGRADLIRSWTADPSDEHLAAELADSLGSCLSCSACTGRCPVQVDIPEMKSRFLQERPETSRRRQLRQHVLGRFEALAPWAQRAAVPIGYGQRLAAPALASVLGILDLPTVPSGTLERRTKRLGIERIRPGGNLDDATVIIIPDVFSCVLDPAVLEACIALLKAVGETPVVGPLVPSGKYDHVKGNRNRFAKAVAKQRSMLEGLATFGIPLVVIEPAVSMLYGHEFPTIDPRFPSNTVTSFSAYLYERLDLLPSRDGVPSGDHDNGSAQLFGHCTELSLAPEHTQHYAALLERSGYRVLVESNTCCGMAGVFGHEAENQAISKDLFETYWRPLLDRDGPVERCAPGYSCRSQVKRLGGGEVAHPYTVAARAFGLG